MATTTQKDTRMVDLIINGLRKAASELEQFQVQMALGKAEVRDMFEQIKKELHARTLKLKQRLQATKTNENILPIIQAMEQLEIQLALGRAETREIFEEQRKKLERSMHELEAELKNSTAGRYIAKVQLEIEKFKAKLQLLSLAYQLKKISLEYDLKQKRFEFDRKLSGIRKKLEAKEENAKMKWQHFKDEIKTAFSSLKYPFLPLD